MTIQVLCTRDGKHSEGGEKDCGVKVIVANMEQLGGDSDRDGDQDRCYFF